MAKTRIVSKRLTKGPRKGKIIQVYASSGVEVKTQQRRAALGQKFAKPATAKPSATKNHTQAGLHRLGKTGNRYVDKQGNMFMRAKGGKFVRGDASRRQKRAVPRATVKTRR